MANFEQIAEELTPFFCSLCDFLSTDKTSLLKHKTEHLLKETETEIIDSDQQTNIKGLLINQEIPYFCDQCSFASTSLKVVQNHKSRSHNYDDCKVEANIQFKCMDCKKSFSK